MKREFIKELVPEISKEALDAIMAENGNDIQTQKDTISTLQTQLGEANTKLEGYDPTWKEKAEAERQKLEGQQFDFALEKAIGSAKPRNPRAVMALLDREKLSFAGGEVIGLEKQIEALKKGEDTAFLFQETKPTKTGMSHQGARDVGGEDKKEAANEALRSLFGSAE